MRLVIAVGVAMVTLWCWDRSGIPVTATGVAALVAAPFGFALAMAIVDYWRQSRVERELRTLLVEVAGYGAAMIPGLLIALR
ncbi:MAG TPA: hypothetical protein EYP98_03435 [Planctomycetes bacterium]|nr:hypothetical protein [Planctomycetota bacterium]